MDINLLKTLLKPEEELRLKPYHDSVGKLTIGWGRNLTDNGISKKEAEYFLDNDIKDVIADLQINIPWWNSIDEVRQLVLADMCFNMGIASLLKFHNTLNAIKNHNWKAAYDGMLASKWASQVGTRATKLANIMLTGIYVP